MVGNLVIRIQKRLAVYALIAVVFFAAGVFAGDGLRSLLKDFRMPSFSTSVEDRTALMSGSVSLDDDPRLGGKDAKVRIVLFSDYQCPYSAKAEPVVKQIHDTYGDNVLIAFRDLPLDFHQFAMSAAIASECADEQGKFWEYHDKLFENQQALDTISLKKYAADLGLDTAKFDKCVDNKETEEEVKADMADAQSAGVTGTPIFFINGEQVVGAQPFETFKQKIDTALAK